MKKVSVLVSVLVTVVLCFAALSWAQEASFFDDVTGRIIRTCDSCTSCVNGATPPQCTGDTCVYTMYLEVRNPAGGGVDSTYNVSCNSGTPTAGSATITTSQYDDVSLAYNSSVATAYVYTMNADDQPQLSTCAISSSTPPPATYTISGQVTSGSTGLSGVTMTLGGAGSGTTTTGTSGNYSFSNLAAGSYTVTPSLSGYNFTPSSWSGTISGNTTENFTATASDGSNVDLIITSLTVTDPTTGAELANINNGQEFNVNITIKNNGTSPSGGPFVTKCYISTSDTIPSSDQIPFQVLLFSWTVANLNGGQSLSNTFSVHFDGVGVHNSYYIVAKVDADNQIPETQNNQVYCDPDRVLVSR